MYNTNNASAWECVAIDSEETYSITEARSSVNIVVVAVVVVVIVIAVGMPYRNFFVSTFSAFSVNCNVTYHIKEYIRVDADYT